MRNIHGFIIIFNTMNILQAWRTSENCSSYYVIFEETVFGHEPQLLNDTDLRLLDPAIPKYCYIGLHCENIETRCQPRLHEEPKNGSHIFIPHTSVVTKDTVIVTSTTAPRVLTTNSVTETPSVDISPALSTVPPDNITITVTEAPRVSTETFLTENPIISLITGITKAPTTTVSTTPKVYNTDAVTDTSTIKNIDINPAITKPPQTEIPTVSTTDTKTNTPTVANVSATTKAPTVNTTFTATIAPKISAKKAVIHILTVDATSVTSKASTAHTTAIVTETPKISTTIVVTPPATDLSTVDTTVPSAKAPTISTTTTDATTISTKSNVYNTDDTHGDKSDNEYKNERKIDTSHSMMNHLLSFLQNKPETDIILIIVLIAIGLFAFNILCYLALRKADAVTTSERYDPSKYE